MSTGKRLAKRSIIGTRVAAPGNDGIYYTGSIHALKSPASASTEIGLSITSKTRYVVRFDNVPGGRPPSPNTEYARRDLIGPGFGLVSSTTLVQGQKVYLTYNGREINAEVIEHRKQLEEVDVLMTPSGQEDPMTLTRRIDEIRLLESRKSARLADQDTDFARLADMAGDRKRAASHSIEVPHVPGSRKRRPSTSSDYERSYSGGGSAGTSSGSGNSNPVWSEIMGIPHRCGREGCNGFNERGDCMDECTAALVLMSLSCSPHSPHAFYYQQNYGSWGDRGTNAAMAGSPGAGGASSSSSGESWRTGTPSPSLSEEGAPTNGSIWPTPPQHPSHNQLAYPCIVSGLPFEGTTNGALDEGIVSDYLEDVHPQRKKANRKKLYKCNWRGCGKIKATCDLIEDHVRQVHLRKPRDTKAKIKDEEFYYDELTLDHVSSPPTMSHRDMARPPHEDPEYQKMLRLEAAPDAAMTSANNNTSNCSNNNNNNNNSNSSNNTNATNLTVPGGVIRDGSNKIFTFRVSPSPQQQLPQQNQRADQERDEEREEEEEERQQPHQEQQRQQQQLQQLEQQQAQHHQQQQQQHQQQKVSPPLKHIKLSPRPLQVCQQNVRLVTVSTGKITSSRKARSDTKKCRKIYGMTNRELWCTQCKWKKACTRFGE